MSPHLETDCGNVFRALKHWRKTSNAQEFVRVRHSSMKFLLECATKQLLKWMMVLEIELQHAEKKHTLVLIFRLHAAIPERTFIGPVIQVHIIQFLGTHGNAIQIPSTTTPNRTSWVVICRGKNRSVDELHLRDPGYNPTRTELLVERSIAKEIGPCSTRGVAIPHRGNSCDTVRNSEESSVGYERSYSCWRMEVK